MLVIFEGADGLGKSTLAQSLAGLSSWPVYKPAGSPLEGMSVRESQAEDRGAAGLACLLARQTNVIFDRWFPSEYAYGKAYDREFDEKLVWQLDVQVATVPHVAFLMSRLPIQDARELARRGVADVPFEQWEAVNRAYNEYRGKSYMNWKMVHHSSRDGQLALVLSAISDAKRRWLL